MAKPVQRRNGTSKRLTVAVSATRSAATRSAATRSATTTGRRATTRKKAATSKNATTGKRSRYASGGVDPATEFSVAEARWADVAPDLPADLACWVAPPIVVTVRATS